MYAETQWTPLPTGHGPLGLASQKKGQVTPTVREDTHHELPLTTYSKIMHTISVVSVLKYLLVPLAVTASEDKRE